MSKVIDNRNEPVILDLAVAGDKDAIYNYGIGLTELNQASFTISSVGIDAADTVVSVQASNTKDKGFMTVLDNTGAAIEITLPIGDDDSAVFMPEVGFSYLKVLVTRNSSTVGVVTITAR